MNDTVSQPHDRRDAGASPAAAGMDAAAAGQPYTHPVDANVGAARAEEHAAPAPTTRTSGKLWVIAGLVIVAVAAAAGVAFT